MDTSLGERFFVILLALVVIGSVGALTYTLFTPSSIGATSLNANP